MDIYNVKDAIFLENISFEEDSSKIIAENTHNTWQKDRNINEKIRDTKQGKFAEKLIKNYIELSTDLTYIEYDDIRQDNYKKHAPFDGLLYKQSNINSEILNNCLSIINDNVNNSPTGTITADCRELLYQNKIFTVEIKSTQINERKKEIARKINIYNKDRRECLLSAIKENDDFLTYLYFCRFGNFNNFSEYCNFVKSKYPEYSKFQDADLIEEIKKNELANLSDIHIRIYVDHLIKRAIIIGYIKKEHFLENPILIKKMIKYGKSEGAIYLTKPLKIALPFKSLETLF